MTVIATILDDKGNTVAKQEIADTMLSLLDIWGSPQAALDFAMKKLREESEERHVNIEREKIIPQVNDAEVQARADFEQKWPQAKADVSSEAAKP